MTVAVLGNKPDSICFPLGNGVTGDLPSLEGHTAFLTGQNSCHHFCQLCLAAAVDAGNSQDFTAVEGKGNIL